MKQTLRNICAVVLTILCTLPAMAQLNGTGFYRFRNAQHTSDYISIANDKFNYHIVAYDAGGGLSALTSDAGQQRAMKCAIAYLQNDIHMVDDPDIVDLSTVIYAKKYNTNNSDHRYNLIGQGTSLLTLTTGTYAGSISLKFENLYVDIESVGGSGANTLYTASIELKSSTYVFLYGYPDLGIRYFVDEGGKFDADVESVTSQNKAKWYIEPVDHFNVRPDVELNGKYYTTVKVPFGFTLSGQVEKAYKITANNNSILEYQEISGTIPAGTPVLLQCGSPNPADCRLIPVAATPEFTAPNVNVTQAGAPLATDVTTPTGDNLLAGTYYCNTDGQIPFANKDNGTSYLNGNHNESVSGKYAIGKNAAGKLGFVTAATVLPTSVMPGNKAWMLSEGYFPTVATPTITPAVGEYTTEQTVTITADGGTIIHYTTDGSEPTYQSPVYNGPITVGEGTTTIKAIAVKEGLYNNSDVAKATYIISTPVAAPVITPASGAYTGAQTVTITADEDATILYKVGDGEYQEYTAPFIITEDCTITAKASLNGRDSEETTATYTITLPTVDTPTFTPAAGEYVGKQNVTIACATDGATIYYTTDGSEPTTVSAVYNAPITVSESMTIKAIAVKQYYINSSVAEAAYTILAPVAAPVITPASGAYNGAQTVTITTETEDATILYKVNDGEYQEYTAPFIITENCTITAKASLNGRDSEETTATYTITLPTVDTPTFTPAAGEYVGKQNVTIACATDGATIYYTTDGSEPTTVSAVYNAPITVSESMTIKAIAVKQYYINSTIAEAAYTILPPKGDVNRDGFVNVSDVTALISIILGNEPEDSNYDYVAANFNEDEFTNVADVTELIAYILTH